MIIITRPACLAWFLCLVFAHTAFAAPFLWARYDSMLNTRVCTLASRMRCSEVTALVTADEKWSSVENFIRKNGGGDLESKLLDGAKDAARTLQGCFKNVMQAFLCT